MIFKLIENSFVTATTTTSQSFNAQMNSTNKTTPVTVAVSSAPIETTKNSIRPHQILSRETSFISKPVSTEEKDEPTTIPSPIITTVQVTTAPQITIPTVTTTGTPPSTVTITSK